MFKKKKVYIVIERTDSSSYCQEMLPIVIGPFDVRQAQREIISENGFVPHFVSDRKRLDYWTVGCVYSTPNPPEGVHFSTEPYVMQEASRNFYQPWKDGPYLS